MNIKPLGNTSKWEWLNNNTTPTRYNTNYDTRKECVCARTKSSKLVNVSILAYRKGLGKILL